MPNRVQYRKKAGWFCGWENKREILTSRVFGKVNHKRETNRTGGKAVEKAEKEKGLFEKAAPFSSALYYQENFTFRQMEVERLENYPSQGVHLHDSIEMLYFHKGAGTLYINGVKRAIQPGCFAWLFPFHVHGMECAPGTQVTRIQYSLGLLMYMKTEAQYIGSMQVQELAYPCVEVPEDKRHGVETLLLEMEQEAAHKQHGYDMMLFSGLMKLAVCYERLVLGKTEKELEKSWDRAWKMLQYIHFQFNNGLDSAKMEKVFGVTPPRMNRELRLLTGMNFQQNLALVRVRNACAMMQYEELSIPYIASYVGYTSPAAFYRQFKQIKGITPDGYREKNKPPVTEGNPHPSDTARALLIYISEHYREPITIGKAAKELYLSEFVIRSVLEKGYRLSFGQMVTQVRLWVAQGLLLATELTIGDVAAACGFGSERTFVRSFGEEMGCSPTQWRRQE